MIGLISLIPPRAWGGIIAVGSAVLLIWTVNDAAYDRATADARAAYAEALAEAEARSAEIARQTAAEAASLSARASELRAMAAEIAGGEGCVLDVETRARLEAIR